MKLVVIAEALNLRASAPSGRILATLARNTPVTVTGPDRAGWVTVDAQIDGEALSGVVAARYLAAAIISPAEALASTALSEWRRFGCGTGFEADHPYAGYIGQMWSALDQDFDGADRSMPWSAAAISWIVREAARHAPALAQFRYAVGHWSYIKQGFEVRERVADGPYRACTLDEAPVGVGDLVVQSRTGAPGLHDCAEVTSFDAARDCAGSFASHCDLVVGLEGAKALAIGGNVGQSMAMKTYDLDADGHLKAQDKVFMFLQLRV
jgi:hypothetical protein